MWIVEKRVKSQGSRVKGQESRDKSQGTRAHRSLNLRTSELQNLKTKGQGLRVKGTSQTTRIGI